VQSELGLEVPKHFLHLKIKIQFSDTWAFVSSTSVLTISFKIMQSNDPSRLLFQSPHKEKSSLIRQCSLSLKVSSLLSLKDHLIIFFESGIYRVWEKYRKIGYVNGINRYMMLYESTCLPYLILLLVGWTKNCFFTISKILV